MAPTDLRTRAFRPSLASSLALSALMVAFAALGTWQIGRANDKQGLQDRFADRSAPPADGLPESPLALTRAQIEGEYDNRHAFLVDNRVFEGRAGVHVLSPFRVAGTSQNVLVNRGWLPMPADRGALPSIPAITGKVTVTGHLDLVRQPGLTVGDADQLGGEAWPKLLTYPELPALESALGEPLYPMTLYLAPGQPGALEGLNWNPFPMTAARHRGYALTWFALLLGCAVAWFILGMQRGKRSTA
jgi:surfeit locus 1 family protein